MSQLFDPFFALLQGPDLVARTAGEAELAEQWQAHLGWIGSLGSEPVPVPETEVLQRTERCLEHTRHRLISEGRIRAISDDLAVPGFALAFAALRAIRHVPKPPVDPRPVPPARLTHLALSQEQVSHRAPPRDAQWTLFGVSVLLFVVVGALIWDVGFAISLLVVVIFHEFGHFAAMRAFGYRNVHVLALPLVGGVAMGHDVDPGSTKRAWMSLMGPLPGILLGWALLYLSLSAPGAPDWLFPLAVTFLLINYLNVLPIPPLDGAHVLEELLPLRWARLQTLVLGIAAVGGAVAAWHYEFYLLTIIALLQLPGLPGRWKLHGIESEYQRDPLPAGLDRSARMQRVMERLDQRLGPAMHAGQRIGHALHVLHRIDTRPMGHAARAVTALVFVCLLAVPIAGLIGMRAIDAEQAALSARDENDQARRESWQREAAALPLQVLLETAAESTETSLAPPAVDAEIEQAAARLGAELPDDLRRFYLTSNGLAALDLLPVASVGPHPPDVEALLGYTEGKLTLSNLAGEWIEISGDEMKSWWYLGGASEAPVFYLPTPHPSLPGVRLVDAFIESPAVYVGLRAWLENHWVDQKQSDAWMAESRQAQQRSRAELTEAPIETLLAAWPEPAWWSGLLFAELATPGGADEADLVELERRLGLPLPEDLRTVLAAHNGFPPLRLLDSTRVGRWADQSEHLSEAVRDRLYGGRDVAGGVVTGLTDIDDQDGFHVDINHASQIAHCVLVAGSVADPTTGAAPFPRLLWCPNGQPARWVDPMARRGYDRLRDWILPQAVLAHAGRTSP